MEFLKKACVIIVLLVIVGIVFGIRSEQTEDSIKKWAAEKHYVVVKTEMHMTIIGTPFYYLNKGEYIYEIVLDNGDVWWLRAGIFGDEYVKGS